MNLEKLFHLKEHHTDVKTEIMAGITTFMTMAYILAVNPNILSASGMDRGAVFTATALSSFIATCLMALLSNYPFVLAPGMGLNAYLSLMHIFHPGPLVLRTAPFRYPTPTPDRDRTVSRRSEPSSRTALMGEQPNPWDLLQPQDAMRDRKSVV